MMPRLMRSAAPPMPPPSELETITMLMRLLLDGPNHIQREDWRRELEGYRQTNPAIYMKAKAAVLAKYRGIKADPSDRRSS
jgi:hypothetical protein